MALQSFNRGIRELWLALWTAPDTYGAAYKVKGARAGQVGFVVETDELRGDDVVLDRYTKVVAASINIAMASIDLQTFNMLMGGTLVNNVDYYDLKIDETTDPPYVCVAGRIAGSGGVGDLAFQVGKAKIAGPLNLQAATDSYLIPACDMQGVQDGPINGIMRLRHYNVATPITIPLPLT